MDNKKGLNIRYLRNEKNRGSVMKVLNDFLVDIMGAIIPGFLFIFSLGVALGVPIILIYDISIPKSFYNSIFSFGAIILILLLSYVIGHAFYRADINKPDKASIAHKMKIHIKEVCKECKGQVQKSLEKPEGPSESIPEDISYRMRHMLLDRKYLDSSRDKNLAHYVSLFYNELISGTQDDNNTDNVFYIIKNHFDGTDSLNKSSDQGKESKDIATRGDYYNLIDILSDCVEYVVNCYIHQLEYLVTKKLPKKQWTIIKCFKVFFKEVKYIDYCDNYREFHYLLKLITNLKCITSDSELKMGNLKKFIKALEDYKINILEGSGVKEKYFCYYRFALIRRLLNKRKYCPRGKLQKTINQLQKDILLYASIRRMQNEEGTPHKDAGGFPYINYENYLFKRNLHHLAEMVNWNYREGRTKNQINRYKIKIQLFCPDAYGVLNKNESHVRMASSSWFASNFLVWTNVVIILLLIAYNCPLWKVAIKNGDSIVPLTVPLLSPISVGVFLFLLKRKIEDFIHYQRLREIYFALYTYHECKNEIEYKEEYYSHCPFPDNDMFLNEDENEQEQ